MTEGLARQCQSDGQLAALICFELGRMIAEREASRGGTDPDTLPPLETTVGNDVRGTFGDVDGMHVYEMTRYEQKLNRAREAREKAEQTGGATEIEPRAYRAVLEPYAFGELLQWFAWDAFSGLALLAAGGLTAGEAFGGPLKRSDLPRLGASVALGGILAPLLLLAGLREVAAYQGSLLLNLEAVFTALLAWIVFRENVDRRIAFGMLAIVGGGIVLSWEGHAAWGGDREMRGRGDEGNVQGA